MQILSNKVDMLNNLLKIEYDNEPFKLFKNQHKKWENKIQEIDTELMNTYKAIEEEMDFQQEFYEKLKFSA